MAVRGLQADTNVLERRSSKRPSSSPRLRLFLSLTSSVSFDPILPCSPPSPSLQSCLPSLCFSAQPLSGSRSQFARSPRSVRTLQ